MKLDKKDREILYDLDLDARQSNSQIGKKLRLSKDVVNYRVKRMQREGIIKDFVTILNTHSFGYLAFRVFFKFKGMSREDEDEFINFINKDVVWIVRCRGYWSYNTMIYTNDFEKLQEFLRKIKVKFGKKFLKLQLAPVPKVHHYKKDFLVEKNRRKSGHVALGEKSGYTPDETDFKIMEAIVENARDQIVDIAERAGLTSRVVNYRLKRLIEGKIILGFRARVDYNKLGYKYYKMHLFLNDHSEKTYGNLMNLSHYNPNIIYVTSTVGGWDFEVEAVFKDSEEIYSFMDNISQKYIDEINDYEVLEYDIEYQFRYFQVLE